MVTLPSYRAFQIQVVYICAELYQISTGTPASRGPSAIAGLFVKISDPKKRDFIVGEFLKTKKNIQDSYLSERLGDIDIHRKMSKLFKPITEAQQDVKESLLGELRPIKEKLLAIAFPQLQAISAPPGEGEDLDTSGLFIGTIAVQYLRQFTSQQEVDKAFGIYEKDGKFYTVYQKTSTFLFFK